MKKDTRKEKKLSLKKLQMAKITTGMNAIKGGKTNPANELENTGDTHTVVDHTLWTIKTLPTMTLD